MNQPLGQIGKQPWDIERAWAWQRSRPWRIGCNYLPGSAINQLEMWQSDTFDLELIARELGWLAALGMNTVRVFLHDLLWACDASDFLARLDRFLTIADAHGISAMFVFFDSCWHPFPHAGRQREPEPGVHNSFWLQSPGVPTLRNPDAFAQIEPYLTGVIGHFSEDRRVEAWDLWNEPENPNTGSYGPRDLGLEKSRFVLPLLIQAFDWARSANPTQPITSGVWQGNWSDPEKLEPLHAVQLFASDVVSFHCYESLHNTNIAVETLKQYGRPLLCTEYMARPVGSTFESILPYFKQEKIAAYNWGSIAGKSQTYLPWDSWQNPYLSAPKVWFHDILRFDGSPYDPLETEVIRSATGKILSTQ